MPIKSFRGKIADNAIDTITLHTNDGSTGYRIVKFELLGIQPGSVTQESTVQIFSVPQTTAVNTVDFSNQELLGAAFYRSSNSTDHTTTLNVIFDRMVFNHDIDVTHVESAGAQAVNYHIELEQVKLDLNENTVATLKDIRNLS